ncbi:MAG: DUF3656 domain-containing U32 family peptidase, partial [Bacillota bacterium]
MDHLNKPELLAPVGNWNSLYAAVQNGCDAIYVGGKEFNARNRADNFSVSELKEVIDYAHIRGVKVYITMNIVYKEQELNQVLGFVKKIYKQGADAVIVQDLGIAKLISEFFPDIELHGSTQLNIHNLAGAKMLEDLGFSRVILARELSLTEIKEINDNTTLEVETFVHGALCISYSGQCLMSSLIGGRSGNRGRCAQPCRMPYTLIDRDSQEIISEEFSEQHLLSPKDINTLDLIPQLIEAGIASFKIEGRLKRPEYTALVTKTYKKYIDQYFHDRDNYEVQEQDHQQLAQLFNRDGFVPSYYQGQENLDLISYQRPKNWGVKIGEVVNYDFQTKKCKIELEKTVNQGDGLEIWITEGNNIPLTLSEEDRLRKEFVVVKVNKPVQEGSPVYRTSDYNLLSSLAESYQNPDTYKQIDVFGAVIAQIGEKLKLDLWDQDGYFVTAELEFKPESAKKQPLSRENLKEQLSKLGSTPYSLKKLDCTVDDNLFIPISKLNQLRRTAVQKLNQARKEGFEPSERTDNFSAAELKIKKSKSNQSAVPQLTISIKNSDYLESLLKTGVQRIYCPIKNLDLEELKELLKVKQDTELFIALPRIAKQQEIEDLKEIVNKLTKLDIDGFLIPQLGALKLVTATDKSLAADFPLHTLNLHSLEMLQQLGFETAALSPELTLKELKQLTITEQPKQEIIVYGYLAMMISEYCPIGAVEREFDFSKNCNLECEERNYGLLDRKGMVEAIETDAENCRATIYNSQPLHLLNYLDEII